MKDYLHRYVELYPSVSCHLEVNVNWAIYGQGRFRSFTFEEMWRWYNQHKCLQADPQTGSDHEQKMAQAAFSSVRQWLAMKEDDISSKSLKCFQHYILNKDQEVGQSSLSKKHGAVHLTNLMPVLKLHFTEISPKSGPSSSICHFRHLRDQR